MPETTYTVEEVRYAMESLIVFERGGNGEIVKLDEDMNQLDELMRDIIFVIEYKRSKERIYDNNN